MALQAIEAAPKDGNPVFLVDLHTSELTTAGWAGRERVSSQGEAASIAPTRRQPGSKTFEGWRRSGRVVARASVAAGVCVLWLFIDAAADNGLCGESNIRTQSFAASTEMERKTAQPNAMQDKSSLVPRVVEHEQECDSAEVVRALTSSLREELDALRSATEAARIKQKQALDQGRDRADGLARELSRLWVEFDKTRIADSEIMRAGEAEIEQGQAPDQARDGADTLARELTSVRAELDAARIASSEEAVQAAAAETKQKRALDQERDRADALARELTSLRAKLDAAPTRGPEVAQAAAAEVEQKRALKQNADKAAALARELASLQAELETSRAANLDAVRTAEAAKIEQEQALGKQRDRTETLARELASARKEAEERSARLAAAHAEMLQVTETNKATAAEQKLALASERDRADALARELTSVRNELEAGKRQIAALNAPAAPHSRESAVDSSQERIDELASSTIVAKGRSPEQISDDAAASKLERSSDSKLPRPSPQSIAHVATSDLDPKVAIGTERSTSASAASPSSVDEQRLLVRAHALLQQADISGARPLLEHAEERGSARAAFMLAETYDARVLQSWRARGISGDPTKARQLYERAQAGGIEDAKERIETLK